MGNEDRNRKQSVTEIINFVSSLLVFVAGLFGAIKNVGGLGMFAIIIAAFGLSWFAFLLYRFFKRKKHRHRKLHTGKEPGDTGFNEALSYTINDAHRFYGRQNDTFNVESNRQGGLSPGGFARRKQKKGHARKSPHPHSWLSP